jgi:hypothetical protein
MGAADVCSSVEHSVATAPDLQPTLQSDADKLIQYDH